MITDWNVRRRPLRSTLRGQDPARWRWTLARLLNHVPGTCWTDLVGWVWGARRTPWAPVIDSCRRGAAECGRCYCGHLGADGRPWRGDRS